MSDLSTPEKWLPVVGFPGYEVSDHGRVRSYWTREQLVNRKGTRAAISLTCRPLRSQVTRHGYLHMSLYKDGKAYKRKVHTLVLTAFVGPCPVGMEACHFPDPDRTNNHRNNLRWDSRKANATDKEAHGTHRRGSADGNAKLTESQVSAIKRGLNAGELQYVLARTYGVTRSVISTIKSGKTWRHAP